jgi:ribosomal protein L13
MAGTSHEEVIEVAGKAAGRLARLLAELLRANVSGSAAR